VKSRRREEFGLEETDDSEIVRKRHIGNERIYSTREREEWGRERGEKKRKERGVKRRENKRNLDGYKKEGQGAVTDSRSASDDHTTAAEHREKLRPGGGKEQGTSELKKEKATKEKKNEKNPKRKSLQ
jgi:hypothetical protein